MALKLVVQRVPRGEDGQPGEPEAPYEVKLDSDTVQIGRDPASEVVLEDRLISRQHARIWREGPAYFIQDLHSTQGTRLNEQKLTPGDAEPLRNGDVLRLPGFTITFQTWQAAHVPSGDPEGTAFVAKEVLRGAMKSLEHSDPVLRVLSTGDRMELPPGAEVFIGRDPEACDLVIDSEKVSRKHARLRRDWGGATLYDLGSTNGVRVNGQKITRELKLYDRDEIEIGGVRILFIDPTQLREEKVNIELPPEVAEEVARAEAKERQEEEAERAAQNSSDNDAEPGTRALESGEEAAAEEPHTEAEQGGDAESASPMPEPDVAPEPPRDELPVEPVPEPQLIVPARPKSFRVWQVALLVMVGLASTAFLVALLLAE